MTQITRLCQEHEIKTLAIARLELHGLNCPQAPADADGNETLEYRLLCQDYVRGLRGFARQAVVAGMDRLIDEWQYRRWPTVQELRAIFGEEQRALMPRREPKREPICEPIPEHERCSPDKLAILMRAIRRNFDDEGPLIGQTITDGD